MSVDNRTSSHWILFDAFDLNISDFDGVCLVYHGGTGETHYLADQVKSVFELFLRHKMPFSMNRIKDEIEALGLLEVEFEAIDEMLNDLHSRHLITRLD